MNRQLKRANDKSEKRREREQTKRRTQRQASRILRSARPAPKRKTDSHTDKSTGGSSPTKPDFGLNRPWIVRIYLVFSTVVILSQALLPQGTDTSTLLVNSFFYLVLGYFFCLWLSRRGLKQALLYSVGGGLLLALLVEGLKLVIPPLGPVEPGTSADPNLLRVAWAAPGLIAGSFLGQFIYRRS